MEKLSQCCGTSIYEDTTGNVCRGCAEKCEVYEDKPEYHTNDLPEEPTLPGEDDGLEND